MSSVVIIGAQWGDEGKGKIVDALADKADVVVRFQGGDNAGHTVYFDGKKHVFHILPSGILRSGVLNIIGGGVAMNPVRLAEELKQIGVPESELKQRLRISGETHLILPCHPALDRVSEQSMGSDKIGTTLRGIGPSYADRAARIGVRVADVLDEDYFRTRVRACLAAKRNLLPADQADVLDEDRTVRETLNLMRPWRDLIADTAVLLHRARAAGKNILYEGAQGTMLDVNAGSYPYVTSSHTIAGGVCVGACIGPGAMDKVFGVAKAYATRVGEGPFTSELNDAVGEQLRDLGGEYGATTNRPRRCGWMDLVQLRRAAMVNGLNGLVITKMDVLDTFDSIGVCVAYDVGGRRVEEMPINPIELRDAKPIYEFWPGWRAPTGTARTYSALPVNARRYIAQIEKRVGVPVVIVSAGPDRTQMIMRRKIFS